MKIQIAGPGCRKCQETEKNVRTACAEMNFAADISHTYDVREYAKLNVKLTPAVVWDGKILVSGTVPTIKELTKLFKEEMEP